jgi:hypothetical protein
MLAIVFGNSLLLCSANFLSWSATKFASNRQIVIAKLQENSYPRPNGKGSVINGWTANGGADVLSWIDERTPGADASIATGPTVQSASRHMEGALDAEREGAAKAVRFSATAPPRAPVSGGGGGGSGSGGGGSRGGGGGGGASDARRKRSQRSNTLRHGHSVVSGLLHMKLTDPAKKFTEKESIEVLW